jgi:K+-sensing histidine kinase KdpD
MRCRLLNILRPTIRLLKPMTDNAAQERQLDILSPPVAERVPVSSQISKLRRATRLIRPVAERPGAVAFACNGSEMSPGWLILYPGVFFSYWIGGLGVGLFARSKSTAVAQYFFLPPERSWKVADSVYVFSWTVFTLMASSSASSTST